jgi:hypothetical protein
MSIIPNFLYIGLPKTGSTWLFQNFTRHPEIFVPTLKYTEYINQYPDQPLSWYFKHFADATPQHTAVGEFGIYYLTQPGAIEKVKEINPRMKFIFFARPSVDQRISYMFHVLRSQRYEVRNYLEYLYQQDKMRGMPSEHLVRWLDAFESEQFFFAEFHDIAQRPESLLTSVYDFLGVERRPPVTLTSVEENRRQQPRNKVLGNVAFRMSRHLRDWELYELLAGLKSSRLVRRFLFTDAPSFDKDLVPALKAEFEERYAEEDSRLRALTGFAHTPSTGQAPVAVSGTRPVFG